MREAQSCSSYLLDDHRPVPRVRHGRDGGKSFAGAGAPSAALGVAGGLALVVALLERAVVSSGTLDVTFYALTVGTIALLVAYVLATAGALRFLFLGRRRAPAWQVVVPVPAMALVLYTIWRNAAGLDAPCSWFPYVVLAWLAAEVRRDSPNGGLLVTVDELQVASRGDLALLAATLHRLNVDHPTSAVVFAGTALPHVPEVLRAAGVTHPDGSFLVEQLSVSLAEQDATYAVVEPARRVGVAWEPEAAARVVRASNGYPAHLQQFARTVRTTAAGPHVITVDDVARALPWVERDLDRRTLDPRWERMSDRQMEYLAALSLHGRATTRAIAATLGRTPQELSWIRQVLVDEGDVHSPKRGHLALVVPVFAPFVLAHYEEAREDAETTQRPCSCP